MQTALRWFYARDRSKIGPISGTELHQMLSRGELQPTDLILPEGQPRLVPASQGLPAQAVARLQHPNIVQVHEVGEWRPEGSSATLPYFSLEYVEGGTLDSQLAGNPQPPRDSCRFVETLARAVQAAHQHGVVHRDLKP